MTGLCVQYKGGVRRVGKKGEFHSGRSGLERSAQSGAAARTAGRRDRVEHRHGLRGLRARLREVRRDRDGARQGQEVGVPQAGQGEYIHSEGKTITIINVVVV